MSFLYRISTTFPVLRYETYSYHCIEPEVRFGLETVFCCKVENGLKGGNLETMRLVKVSR